jgi:two-component system, OmpR family, sensor histidine kinase KdpD
MLSEGVRRASRGEEVVIGVVETHGRKPIVELSSRLETVPRKKLEYKATIFEEMDVDSILARKPHVVLVDELAHTNIEGSKHAKRYEDVFELLDAGIDVLSTLNVQHIESLAPTIRELTGVQVRETVPDWVIRRAGEIVMADLTPQASADPHAARRYLSAGAGGTRAGEFLPQHKSGSAARTGAAPGNAGSRPHAFGTKNRRWPAAAGARADCGMHQFESGGTVLDRPWGAHGAGAGWRPVFFYVDTGADESDENQRTLADNIRFAESVGAKVVKAEGKVVAEKVAEFVRENHITQVVFGRSATKGWKRYFYLSAIHKFLRDTPAVDVHIVTQEMR